MFQMAKQMKAENFRVIGFEIFWRAQTPGSLACTAVHVVYILDKHGAAAIVNVIIVFLDEVHRACCFC
jgi:hypothetical protein